MYIALADAVLLLHFAIVLFVVGGLVLIVVGNLCHWRWVNSRAFRYAHLLAIGFVVIQAWLGATCPLTTLESWLRLQSGQLPYESGFIQHWFQLILFYQAPSWIFAALYTGFGALVGLIWWLFPPAKLLTNSSGPAVTRKPGADA